MSFTLFSIPVRINPLFWLIVLLIVVLNASTLASMFVWGGVVFLSVLIHEMGHALTARAFGQQAQIELYGLGGVTKRRGDQISHWKEFLIVLNGPLAGLTLAVVASILLSYAEKESLWQLAFFVTAIVNFFWTVLNLLPVQPLDGGQLLRILLQASFGFKGMKISVILSLVFALFLGLFAFSYGQFFIGIVFMLLTFENLRVLQSLKGATAQDQDVQFQKLLVQAESEENLGNHDLAIKIYQSVREKTKAGLIYNSATEALATLYNEQEKISDAYQLLAPIQSHLSPTGIKTFFNVAKQLQKFKTAIEVGNEFYQLFPSWETAIELAKCHAQLKEVIPSVGWFERAIQEGLPHVKETALQSEFEPIRHETAFQAYLQNS